MRRLTIARGLVGAPLALFNPAAAAAQAVANAEIRGVISDSSGAVVPAAQIKATQTVRGAVRAEEAGESAGSPAAERTTADVFRGARGLLAGQSARRLHGHELRRRLRHRPEDAADPLPDVQRARRRVPARDASGERGLPVDRAGEVQGHPHQPPRGRQIDIYRFKMDGTGKDFQGLTYFNDYEGWKASNLVISTDGKWMAFQIARAADEAGAGCGIMLHRLED